jgi:hypothetical protein
MTSSNFVEIDWSQTSHSFVQLGEPGKPYYDSTEPIEDAEMLKEFTMKDIFFLDIDDILPPSAFTAPVPIKKKKFSPFFVSFKKFHVTTPKRSGFNKIYEIRRSRSYFFELADRTQNTNDIHLKIYTNDYHMNTKPISYNNTSSFPSHKYQISCMLTHFFSSQRVIPRRIQDKYFNFLRNKLLDRIKIITSRASSSTNRNYSTKTFFNFTYKKRRFYFGIYKPCPHVNDSEHFPKDTQCGIPTPFVMSQHRSACVTHQHIFAKTQCFKNIKPQNTKYHQILLITSPLTPIYYTTGGLKANQNVSPLDDWVFHIIAIFMLEILLRSQNWATDICIEKL